MLSELEVLALSELVVGGGDDWSSAAAATVKLELEAKILSGSCVSDIGCRLDMTSMIKVPVCVGVKLNGIFVPCSD